MSWKLFKIKSQHCQGDGQADHQPLFSFGKPHRHLLSTGWSTFVTSKRLVAGDTFVFLRGDNGELRVGVRRLAPQQSSMPSFVISSQSMHQGVLATASHAVATQTLFVVYYKPRTSQFIISVNKYLDAINHKSSVGMRFDIKGAASTQE